VTYKEFYIDDGLSLKTSVKEVLYSDRSDYQKIEVVDTDKFGLVLCLDDTVQVCTKDYHNYHMAFISAARDKLRNGESALIIGGGDGVLARYLLDDGVKDITQVELDPKVISVSRRYLKDIHKDSFDEIIVEIAEGSDFVKRSDKKFDYVFCDVTDFCDSHETYQNSGKVFTDEFFADLKSVMKSDSVFVCQTDLPFYWDVQRQETLRLLRKHFKMRGSYMTPVHSYGGLSSFVWASDTVNLGHQMVMGDCSKYLETNIGGK
tara:strand:- start:659 stop:1444 length:786 start_codon:yes stop_codon:yes gene_type:complete